MLPSAFLHDENLPLSLCVYQELDGKKLFAIQIKCHVGNLARFLSQASNRERHFYDTLEVSD